MGRFDRLYREGEPATAPPSPSATTARGHLCNRCSGSGRIVDWLIPGYGWGTVRGVKNRRIEMDCRCCDGSGSHDGSECS